MGVNYPAQEHNEVHRQGSCTDRSILSQAHYSTMPPMKQHNSNLREATHLVFPHS